MHYLYLQSALHSDTILKQKAEEFFAAVKQKSGISFVPGTPAEVGAEAVSVIYIATGGTAGMLKAALSELGENIIIVTSSIQNSLSASMESLTYINQLGRNARLVHGEPDKAAQIVASAVCAAETVKSLRGMRLGLVGKPSDWLISTAVDYASLKEKTGISVEEVSMDELLSEIAEGSYDENNFCRELMEKDFDKAQIKQALEIYGAFRRIVDKHGFDGVSVRCFDLLSAVKNTGCLGLAILNACGIYGACESDLPSLISMAIMGRVSGLPVFMCNPSRVDRERNEITFAHCTLPLNMAEKYSLDTHFESRIGVAVSADIPLGKATVFKASADLGHYFVSSGEIVETLHDPNLCRTQIKLRCSADTDSFLNSHVGNHYLVCLGDWEEELRLTMELLGAGK